MCRWNDTLRVVRWGYNTMGPAGGLGWCLCRRLVVALGSRPLRPATEAIVQLADVLAVYVPAEGSDLHQKIWPASGIVGSEVGKSAQLRLDFEGDTTVYPTYADRVRRAAERHLHVREDGHPGYPTQACAYVSSEEVLQVGRWEVEGERLIVTRHEPLDRWLEGSEGSDPAASG